MLLLPVIILVIQCLTAINGAINDVVLSGLRVESIDETDPFTTDVVVKVHSDLEIRVLLFGFNLDKVLSVLLTTSHKGEDRCSLNQSNSIHSEKFFTQTEEIIVFDVKFKTAGLTYYICLSENFTSSTNATNLHLMEGGNVAFRFQGTEQEKMIRVTHAYHQFYMPLPLQIIFIIILLCLSALFSGLNIGLMALDLTELQVIKKSGSKKEKSYAERIIPVRKRGNYLLCTILIGIAVVNSSVSILFDDITSGLVALIVSSFLIVVFGEIVPQSICTRYGLAVGAYTIYLTQFFMTLTFPVAWPTSKLLDKIFGRDFGKVYTRKRLIELIKLSTKAQKELELCQEVAIISGALQLNQKTVETIMTPIEEIFMLDINTILTPDSVGVIAKNGHTRIPLYQNNRETIVNVLNIKDLALVDPDDNMPLSELSKFHPYPVRLIAKTTPISTLLEEFKMGRYHMAFVQELKNEENHQLIGLVTLEDIIEEIIQSEIYDESDVAAFQQQHQKFTRDCPKAKNLDQILDQQYCIPSDLVDTTAQFLRSSLEAFSPSLISDKILHRLIMQNVKSVEKSANIYTMGKAANYYTVVLQGTLEMTAGREQFIFEVGSFQPLGEFIMKEIMPKLNPNLTQDQLEFLNIHFIPDYTARITSSITYLQISTVDYYQAYIATLIEYEAAKLDDESKLESEQMEILKLQYPGTIEENSKPEA